MMKDLMFSHYDDNGNAVMVATCAPEEPKNKRSWWRQIFQGNNQQEK